jgi:predicted house-cleaning noncanonical NTP pyrophosphatase (MazG superfamily)
MRVDYNKLVRDRIPEIIGSHGDRAVTRVLDEADYREALPAKLVEEAQEALADFVHRTVIPDVRGCCKQIV